MDRFSFVAPARAKVLVVPVAGLSGEKFDRYFQQIKSANDIRLLDVTPIPECRYFNPQAFPQGRVFYDFATSFHDEESVFLHDFEPFRKTMIVLGVGEYDKSKEDASLSDLRSRLPTAIVHNCIFFNSPVEVADVATPNVYYLTSPSHLSITAMETTICSVTRSYLKALDECAASYESMSLRSPVSLVDSNVLTRTINLAQKRISSGSSFKVSFSNGQDVSKSTDVKLKALQKQTGRHSKLMGNFFLLAGKCNDALQYFTDAAINAKKCDDYLWLASALEGLATSAFILAYLDLPFHVQNPMLASILLVPKNRVVALGPSTSRVSTESLGTKSSVSVVSPRNSTSSSLGFGFSAATLTGTVTDFSAMPLPEFLRVLCLKASQYYQLSATEIEDCVPDLVYVAAIIRHVKLMVTIYLGASTPLRSILESVIKSIPIILKGSKEGSLVLKCDIIQEVDKVFSLQLVELDFNEQCHVYCSLASIYSDLKLYRKQAFILRILLVALLPKVARMAKRDTVADLNSLASISSIFLLLFQVYHIDSEPERKESMAKDHISDWSTLQILIIKICLRIAESLQDYKTLAKLCVLTSTRYSHCLLPEDQIKLKEKLNWLNLLLANNESDDSLPHSDPFMVRNIKFVVTPSASDLVPFADVEQSNGPANGAVLFNPFNKSKTGTNKERLICVNEVHQLKVTLQNPFPYDVDLDEIAVASDDIVKVETIRSLIKKVSSTPISQRSELNGNNGIGSLHRRNVVQNGALSPVQHGTVVLERNSVSQVIVSFKALNPGKLTIKGLTLKAGNSRNQLFLILELEKACELQKIKTYGILAPIHDEATLDKLIHNLSQASITERVITKELSLGVIARQPSLSVIKNLITNGWVMLLEGEKQHFSLELKNTSADPVNYLSFSFWDSTTDSINNKLSQPGAYAAEDVYELEWQLIKNRPFQVLNKQELATRHKVIKPNGDFRIDYEINGKRGMTDLKLILEYSNKKADTPGENYMKTVSVPLSVSIQPSLDIVGCDVIPFFSSSLHGYVAGSHEGGIIQRNMDSLLDFIATTKTSTEEDISSYALLVLDVKNSWKHKLCANISNSFATREKYVVNEVLDTSETCRFLLPVKRIGHDVVDTSKPIPSLRNKQFIKNYNISKEDEIQERKDFWIKSILLEGLSGKWNTVDLQTERSGVLDTRCIRLNRDMTNVLVYDSILIQHSIFLDDGLNKEIQEENNEYRLEREQFYVLKTKIINHTHDSLTGTLRHVPFPVNAATKQELSIELKILYNGELQKHIGKKSIPRGQSLELSLGFLILDKGRYEWGCVFDVAKERGKRVIGREPVYINAS